MKKSLVMALAVTMAIAAAGCGSSNSASSAATAASSAAAAADSAVSEAAAAADSAVSEAAAAADSAVAAAADAAASKVEAAVDTAVSTAENAIADVTSGAEDAAGLAAEVVGEAVSAAEELSDDEISAAVSTAEEALAGVQSAVEDAAAAAESQVEEALADVQSAVEQLPLADVESMPAAIEEAFSDVSSAATAVEGVESAAEDVDHVMTYAEYVAAPLDSKVMVETYVQAKQSWWEDKATVYTQSEDGAYFLYNMECSEEDYDKLVEGQKIVVTGYKSEWAGEIEIIDATFELADGNYVADVKDATALLGTDELIDSQNQKVAFKGLTVEASKDAEGNEAAFLYNWDGSGQEGDNNDLYFNASVDGATYTFVVESYLCDQDSDVYKAVQALNVGDRIDLEGFLYWYEGAQPHITSVAAAE